MDAPANRSVDRPADPPPTPADGPLLPREEGEHDPPSVQPLDVDGTRTVLVGTLLWAAAFLVLLPFWGRLEDAGRLWWLWTCGAGVALGLLGWTHCRRRARRRLRRGPPPG